MWAWAVRPGPHQGRRSLGYPRCGWQDGGVELEEPLTVVEPTPSNAEPDTRRPGLSAVQIGVLIAALAFLGGAVGYAVGHRSAAADPFNAVDVGFMQDMGYHHDQATELSIILLDKDVDPDLKAFAQEIIIGQRYEQGIYSALLDRWGHSSDPGETVMGWMGEEQPAATMDGLATEEQIDELIAAEGDEAEALWIALMSEHHLAGLQEIVVAILRHAEAGAAGGVDLHGARNPERVRVVAAHLAGGEPLLRRGRCGLRRGELRCRLGGGRPERPDGRRRRADPRRAGRAGHRARRALRLWKVHHTPHDRRA